MIRELTSAELDFVGGGPGMVGGCNTRTATYATQRTTSCGCGESFVQELIVDILKILDGYNGGTVKQRAAL